MKQDVMKKSLKKPQSKTFFRRIKIVMKSPLRERIKKINTIPEKELTKEEEHYAMTWIIKKFQKSPKSLCSTCAESENSISIGVFVEAFTLWSCTHPTYSFASTFLTNCYICLSYTENSYKSFYCYTSLHLSFM